MIPAGVVLALLAGLFLGGALARLAREEAGPCPPPYDWERDGL